MICHLIPDEKFTCRVVDFILNNYADGLNRFVVYNEGKKYSNINSEYVMNVHSIFDKEKEVLDICNQSDYIIIHGFGAKQIVMFFNKHIKLAQKAVIIIWGGDLYNDHIFLEEHDGFCLRLRLFIYAKKRFIKKAPIFMTFTYCDYDRAHEWLGANGKRYDCLYPSNLSVEKLYDIEKRKNYNQIRDTYNIMVGNSATKTNNHYEAFEAIKKFKDENIEVVCPLSYGDMEYAKEIEIAGREIFGNKFIPIKDYLSIDEYSQLLSDMDVVLFPFDRQQATANLEIVAYFGAKVYIKKQSALWKHYVERDRCSFCGVDEIYDMSFDKFISFDNKERKINREYFEKIWDCSYIKTLWDQVLLK